MTGIMNYGLTNKIIGAAIEVHRALGPGLLEIIYEKALCYELDLRHINYKKQVNIDVVYKGKAIHGQRIDLIIEDSVILELKAINKLPTIALSYLIVTGLKTGLLINFNEKTLSSGIKRISM
jgi:GxxExxY protein